MADVYCECEDWKMRAGSIRMVGKPYFVHCPWCGNQLIDSVNRAQPLTDEEIRYLRDVVIGPTKVRDDSEVYYIKKLEEIRGYLINECYNNALGAVNFALNIP